MNSSAYPIRVVVDRTGLKADLIRVWERRYQAVTPDRSPTGRRLYSDEDISRLNLLRSAVESGWRIGDVSARSDDDLAELVAGHERALTERSVSPDSTDRFKGSDRDYLRECIAAMDTMDISLMEKLLGLAEMEQGFPGVFDNLVAPLLVEIGLQWQKGEIKIGQEHMVSAALRHYLDSVRARGNMNGNGPTLLSTTPAGETHELGALMTAATAATLGWNSKYMTPNTPATDIAWVARALDVRAVALSIVYPANNAVLHSELRNLTSLLPADTYLLLGGSSAALYQSVLQDSGNCVFLNSQKEVREFLASHRD